MWMTTQNRPKSGTFVELSYENDSVIPKYH